MRQYKQCPVSMLRKHLAYDIGHFDTAEEAHAAYMAAKAVLHEGYVA